MEYNNRAVLCPGLGVSCTPMEQEMDSQTSPTLTRPATATE